MSEPDPNDCIVSDAQISCSPNSPTARLHSIHTQMLINFIEFHARKIGACKNRAGEEKNVVRHATEIEQRRRTIIL